jgi:hypothetical protein
VRRTAPRISYALSWRASLRGGERTDYIEINREQTEVPAGAVAYKYADPIEDTRWLYDEDAVRAVEREDPSLIVRIEPPRGRYHIEREQRERAMGIQPDESIRYPSD